MTRMTANPRRIPARCNRDTAGASRKLSSTARAIGISTSRAKYNPATTRAIESSVGGGALVRALGGMG